MVFVMRWNEGFLPTFPGRSDATPEMLGPLLDPFRGGVPPQASREERDSAALAAYEEHTKREHAQVRSPASPHASPHPNPSIPNPFHANSFHPTP